MATWKNVKGTCSVDILVKDGRCFAYSSKTVCKSVVQTNGTITDQKYVTEEVEHSGEHFQQLLPFLKSEYGELKIHFLSSGYYVPAKLYGRNEDCYPEEFDDERQFDYAELDAWLPIAERVKLENELGKKFFDEFFHLVENEQIDANQDFYDEQ